MLLRHSSISTCDQKRVCEDTMTVFCEDTMTESPPTAAKGPRTCQGAQKALAKPRWGRRH